MSGNRHGADSLMGGIAVLFFVGVLVAGSVVVSLATAAGAALGGWFGSKENRRMAKLMAAFGGALGLLLVTHILGFGLRL